MSRHPAGLCDRGGFGVRLADGGEEVFEAGDAFVIEPGHIPMAFEGGEHVAFTSVEDTRWHHLKVLRKTGLLVLERQGKPWLYRTAPELVRSTLLETSVEVGDGPAAWRPSAPTSGSRGF